MDQLKLKEAQQYSNLYSIPKKKKKKKKEEEEEECMC